MSDGPLPSSLKPLLEIDPHPKPMPLLFKPAQVLLGGGGAPAGYFFLACGLVFTVLKRPWLDQYTTLSLAEEPHPIRVANKSTLANGDIFKARAMASARLR
jgi:hypothetical protein